MKEKNIEKLKIINAKLKLIRLILMIIVIPSFLLIGFVAPYSTIGATIILIIAIINIIAIKILKETIYQNEVTIYNMNTITKAIQDSKE